MYTRLKIKEKTLGISIWINLIELDRTFELELEGKAKAFSRSFLHYK